MREEREMKKRIFAGLLAFMMMLSVVPVTEVSAASKSGANLPAPISDDVIDTEAELVDAFAKGGEIVLGDKITIGKKIVVDKNVTIDLNGYTISGSCNASEACIFYINNGVVMTIQDSSAPQNSTIGNGKITFEPGSSNVGYIFDVEGQLILDSGIIELTGEWSIGYCVDIRPNAWGLHILP